MGVKGCERVIPHLSLCLLSIGLLYIFGDRGVFEETSKGNPVVSIILRSSSVGGGRGFCGSGLAARAMASHIERWLRAMVDFL